MVDDVLIQGTRRARAIARETMSMVYDAVGLFGPQLLARYGESQHASGDLRSLPYC